MMINKHDESRIQQACVNWFRYQFPRLTRNLIAIPNGYKTSISQARIAKAEGVMAGAADLFLFVARGDYHGLAIEMKTKEGRQQTSQKRWQMAVEAENYKYIICRSVDEFQKEINDYLCM